MVVQGSTWAERLDHAVERTGIDGGESGALIERVRLPDGSSYVVKTEKTAGFSLAHIAGDDGRLVRLWEADVFHRLPPAVDHAMVAVERTADGWLIVMHDVADALLDPDVLVPRAHARRALEAIVAVHDVFRSATLPALCPLSTYAAIAPPPDFPDTGTDFMRKIRTGWDRFRALAPTDVWDVLEAVRRAPASLIAELESRPASLVHGDFWLRNIGFLPDRTVILDWGNLTLCAPPAIDFANLLLMMGAGLGPEIDAARDEIEKDYREVAGATLDERAVGLALIFMLAIWGWGAGLGDGVNWWCDRVRRELDATWAP